VDRTAAEPVGSGKTREKVLETCQSEVGDRAAIRCAQHALGCFGLSALLLLDVCSGSTDGVDPVTTAPTTLETDDASPERAPLVYLGLRRGWWVVVSVLLLSAVDALPMVGPYLALAVLMWMATGLAKAAPRQPKPARAARAARPARRSTDRRRSGETALPTS
jgi:hypothetical protein